MIEERRVNATSLMFSASVLEKDRRVGRTRGHGWLYTLRTAGVVTAM
jgi:hypothetical protein